MSNSIVLTWDQALMLHRLLGAAYGVLNEKESSTKIRLRVRHAIGDLVAQDLPPRSRALLNALDKWLEKKGKGSLTPLRRKVTLVHELYSDWFERCARADMERWDMKGST